jgi:hypothetical protein
VQAVEAVVAVIAADGAGTRSFRLAHEGGRLHWQASPSLPTLKRSHKE